MLTALICRDMFSNITILERQTKEKFFLSRYTFPVILTPCANDVLKQVEGLLDTLRPTQSPYDDMKLQFKVLGRRFSIYKTYDGRLNSFWRDSLIQAQYELVSKAKNIDMHFGCEVESIDFDLNICHEAKLERCNLTYSLVPTVVTARPDRPLQKHILCSTQKQTFPKKPYTAGIPLVFILQKYPIMTSLGITELLSLKAHLLSLGLLCDIHRMSLTASSVLLRVQWIMILKL